MIHGDVQGLNMPCRTCLPRLAQYVDRWTHWAEKELWHIMVHVRHKVAHNMTFITCGNDEGVHVGISINTFP